MFAIRRMTPADRPAMIDISSRIWEGRDYLPIVFDDWVADSKGAFLAVTLDGRLVGCAKLTFLTPTDVWFEGLRKDPRVKEPGLGQTVARHVLSDLAARRDLTSIRFSTGVRNLASITLNERVGFRRILALSYKTGPVPQAARVGRARHAVSVLAEGRLVFPAVERSDWLQKSRGLVVEGWKALPYQRELFQKRYVDTGSCRGVVSHGEVLGLAVSVAPRRGSSGREAGRIRLVSVEARDDEIADDLYEDIVGRTGGRHAAEAEWVIPPLDQPRRLCQGWGLSSREQEEDFLLYEFPLAELARFRS